MMKKAKITKFKNTLNSAVIPATQSTDNGFVGKTIENILKSQGLPIDSTSIGADVQEFDLEIKTRKAGSKADVSIGSMTVDSISQTTYQNSPIKEKVQTVRWIEYREDIFEDTSTSVVKDDLTLDLNHPSIQKEIEFHYNAGVAEISRNNDAYKVNTRYGWWEKRTKNSWAFRIPYSNWQRYVIYSRGAKSYQEMFSE